MNYYELTLASYEDSTNRYHYRIVQHLIKGLKYIKVKKLEKVDITIGYKLIDYLKNHTQWK